MNCKFLFLATGILFLLYIQTLFSQTDANIPVRGICIYIDYPDAPAGVSPLLLDSMLNSNTYQGIGINRSLRKYWYQESRRNFDVQHDIFFYRAPQPSTHYDTVHWSDGIKLWKDALEWVITNHPSYNWAALSKWSLSDSYDAENPNRYFGGIKSTIIISSVFRPAGIGATHFPRWTLSNAELVGSISGSVLQAPWHATQNLFVLFHETGHALFNLPDTYDYDASSAGTGKYSVMSAQGPDVEPVGAPFLMQHNWGYVKEPTIGTHTYTLPADGDTVVIIRNIHDPEEFLAIEARKNSTPGNSLFPAPLGLLIWHSDKKVHTGNNLENATRYAHYKHAIVQKDGLLELEAGINNRDIGDIYLPGDTLSDSSFPHTKWWSGEASGIEIKDIQFVGTDKIQVTVVIPTEHEEHFDFVPKDDWRLISATTGQLGYDGAKAFDDDENTFYHVPFSSSTPRPHEMIIDLGANYELNEFYYTANNHHAPPWEGRIENYELYISDGVNWGSPTVSDRFFRTHYRQYTLFPNEMGRYIKISALNSYGNDSRTSIAEIDIRGREVPMTDVDHDMAIDLRVFPNPTTDYLRVEGLHQECILKVSNAVGITYQVVEKPTSSTIVDLQDCPSGLYVLTVFDQKSNQVISKKIIKND